jgi:hypothetical protein
MGEYKPKVTLRFLPDTVQFGKVWGDRLAHCDGCKDLQWCDVTSVVTEYLMNGEADWLTEMAARTCSDAMAFTEPVRK